MRAGLAHGFLRCVCKVSGNEALQSLGSAHGRAETLATQKIVPDTVALRKMRTIKGNIVTGIKRIDCRDAWRIGDIQFLVGELFVEEPEPAGEYACWCACNIGFKGFRAEGIECALQNQQVECLVAEPRRLCGRLDPRPDCISCRTAARVLRAADFR